MPGLKLPKLLLTSLSDCYCASRIETVPNWKDPTRDPMADCHIGRECHVVLCAPRLPRVCVCTRAEGGDCQLSPLRRANAIDPEKPQRHGKRRLTLLAVVGGVVHIGKESQYVLFLFCVCSLSFSANQSPLPFPTTKPDDCTGEYGTREY